MRAPMGPCQVNSIKALPPSKPLEQYRNPLSEPLEKMLAACKERMEIEDADLPHQEGIKAKLAEALEHT